MLGKLQSILSGWANLVFESAEVEAMAKQRAEHCADCDNAVDGLVPAMINDKIEDVKGLYCNQCTCPLSAKIRSPYESCPIGLWPTITK